MGPEMLSNISTLSSVFGMPGQIASTFLQNKANKESTQENRDWELKMWQMNNEYNSPQKQMERLRAAGLNPNLVYGSGGGTVGNSGSIPAPSSPVNYRSPSIDLPNIMQVMSTLQNIKYLDQKTKTEQFNTLKAEQDYDTKALDNSWRYAPYSTSNEGANNYFAQQALKLQQIMSNMNLQRELTRIRNLEGNMNEQLKPYNMTAQDPAWLRGLLFLGNKTGLFSRYLNNGILQNYQTGPANR